MAASSVIPARRSDRGSRDVVARAAARTAPRGPGLAPVVALPLRHEAGRVPQAPATVSPVGPPRLRLVVPPRRRGSAMGRRVLGLVALALVTLALVGAARSLVAQPEPPVAAGHVVLAPGETLWDVAVRSAPAGVDPRAQLDALRRLNGFGSATLDAWTVVLIPAS